jgi:chemotaxis protein methyltransferase CheR
MSQNDPPDATLSSEDFGAIRTMLANRVGIALGDDKRYFVINQLTPLMRTYELASFAALVRQLRSHSSSSLWDEVIDVLTVHETSFFRDEAPFCQLRDEIMPAICRDAERDRRTLRIWSAGCSTGQEAYSVAMLLMELSPDVASRARILGSDVSGKVLRSAKLGRFRPMEVERGLSERRLHRFFKPVAGTWQAVDQLRAMIDWQHVNLTSTWPTLPRFDLVLLRNVMVYFESSTRNELIQKVHGQLQPSGRLVIGSAESLMGCQHSFRIVSSNGATHYVAQ